MNVEQMPVIEVPLVAGRVEKMHALKPARWARLQRFSEMLKTQRPVSKLTPRPHPGITALLEALATGRLGLVRMDDERREVLAVVDGEVRVVARDPETGERRAKKRLWYHERD